MATEIAKQQQGKISPSESKPQFLRERGEQKGVDEVVQYIRPPFIKIVQGSSDKELKEQFPEKSVILAPGNDLLAAPDEIIRFTPILFFREFLVINPLEWRGQEKMIHARTFDPNSDIAKRAFDPNRRNEQLFNTDGSPILVKGKPIYRSYQDTRTYLVLVHWPRNPGTVCAMTFARAELQTADRLASLIGGRQADIFAGIFEASVGIHKNPQHDWYGFNMDNPSDGSPWVTEAEHAEYSRMHDLLYKALQERRIIVDETGGKVEGQASTADEVPPDGVVKDGDAF